MCCLVYTCLPIFLLSFWHRFLAWFCCGWRTHSEISIILKVLSSLYGPWVGYLSTCSVDAEKHCVFCWVECLLEVCGVWLNGRVNTEHVEDPGFYPQRKYFLPKENSQLDSVGWCCWILLCPCYFLCSHSIDLSGLLKLPILIVDYLFL
jgi:hypothetical protein